MPLSPRALWFVGCLLPLFVVLVFHAPHSTKAQSLVPVTRDPNFGGDGVIGFENVEGGYQVTDILQTPNGNLLATVQEDNSEISNQDFVVVRRLSNGSPDLAFGINGVAKLDFGGQDDISNVLTTTSDDNIWVAGYSNREFGIAKFLPDGAVDTTFGNNGRLVITGTTSFDSIVAIAPQPNGKVLLLGNGSTTPRTTVFQLLPDGTPDPTFGINGTIPIPTRLYTDLESLDDGRFLISGSDGSNSLVTRYLSTGMIDTEFGNNGDVVVDVGNNSSVKDLAITIDRKILFSTENSIPYLIRLLPDGALDSNFGSGGIAVLPNTGYLISDVLPLANGGVIAVLTGNGVLIKVLENGDIDTTFGDNGILGGMYSAEGGLIEAIDGDIVLSGSGTFGARPGLRSIRATGYADRDFGERGYASTRQGGNNFSKAIIQQDPITGDFLALTNNNSFGVMSRLSSEGVLDIRFGDQGIFRFERWLFVNASHDSVYPTDLVLDDEGRTLVTGRVGNSTPFVARFLPDGTPDYEFGQKHGVMWWQEGITFANAEEVVPLSDGKILVGFRTSSSGTFRTIIIRRLNEDGWMDPTYGNNGSVAIPNCTIISGSNALSYSLELVVDSNGRATCRRMQNGNYQWRTICSF